MKVTCICVLIIFHTLESCLCDPEPANCCSMELSFADYFSTTFICFSHVQSSPQCVLTYVVTVFSDNGGSHDTHQPLEKWLAHR